MDEKIKMFIGGEEVVSNKEFKINEEMLSASSTILNNCYPKDWELSRDYISEFYYPKDYSKFLLAKGKYEYGDTEFTPIKTSGKNLVYSSNKVGNTLYLNDVSSQTEYIFKAGTYTLSFTTLTTPSVYIRTATTSATSLGTGSPRTFTSNEDFNLWIYRSGMADNEITNIQLEKGNQATSYVPYGQDISYETNVEKKWDTLNVYGNTYQETTTGKNLFDINGSLYAGSIDKVNNGFKLTKNETYRTLSIILPKPIPAGTYKLSWVVTNSTLSSISSGLGIQVRNNSSNLVGPTAYSHGATFTINSEATRLSVFIVNSEADNTTITLDNVMIESGNTGTEYEKYTGGIPSPNPDYPERIENVGYQNVYDYKTSTFSNANASVVAENEQVIMTVNNTTASNNIFFLTKIPDELLKDGVLYTLSYENVQGIKNVLALQLRNKDGTNAGQTKATSVIYDSRYSLYVMGNIFSTTSSEVIQAGTVAIAKNMQVTEQATKPYIPFGKYGIEITNCGKNLFDGEIELGNISADTGELSNSTTRTRSKNFIKVYPNTIYTITRQVGQYRWVIGYTKNKVGITDGLSSHPSAIVQLSVSTKTISFTTTPTTEYIKWYDTSSTNLTEQVQIELGSHSTTYEPYKANTQTYIINEPLRQVSGYRDRLFVENGTLFVDRQIGSIILDGTETGWYNAGGGAPYSLVVNDLKRVNTEVMVMSSHFIGVAYSGNWNNYDQLITVSTQTGAAKYIKFKYPAMANLDSFKNWLSTHNVEAQYVLETPVREPIGTVDIPNSYEGINNVFFDTGLQTPQDITYYWKNFDVVFAGVVKNSGDISINPRYPHYCSLQILDYKTFLSESDTLDFVISDKTIKEAIEMVINAVSGYGFVVGNIDIEQEDEIIGAYSTLNKTAYDVLQYLANISGSRWRTRYIDSSTMAIDFYDPDRLPQASDIEYTQAYWEDNNIVDITFNYGSRDYRNKQIMLSDQVYGNIDYTEIVVSDGYNTSFVIQSEVGYIKDIVVNGEEKTSTTTDNKQMGADADFYYTPGKNIIESNVVYPAGTQIVIIYTPLIKGRQIIYNNDEVNRIKEQTDTVGVIARYENRNDVVSSNDLEKIGQSYIKYKGKSEVILKVTTQNKDLFNIGELVYFDAPINDLKQNYMVKSKETEYIINGETWDASRINLFYVYELTSSFNSEKTINYFDNQRNKTSGNISEGESITRNIDVENEAVINWVGATVTQPSITIDGDNKLNSVLNSPFIE